MVQVQNEGFSDMVVYAVSGGQRIRLGVATGIRRSDPHPEEMTVLAAR